MAAREILLEIDILLQRLMHLAGSPKDEEQVILEAARQLYHSRRLRDRIFGSDLFADPAWDILLDLFIAQREDRKVTISSACAAASAPTSTAARHIAHLREGGGRGSWLGFDGRGRGHNAGVDLGRLAA